MDDKPQRARRADRFPLGADGRPPRESRAACLPVRSLAADEAFQPRRRGEGRCSLRQDLRVAARKIAGILRGDAVGPQRDAAAEDVERPRRLVDADRRERPGDDGVALADGRVEPLQAGQSPGLAAAAVGDRFAGDLQFQVQPGIAPSGLETVIAGLCALGHVNAHPERLYLAGFQRERPAHVVDFERGGSGTGDIGHEIRNRFPAAQHADLEHVELSRPGDARELVPRSGLVFEPVCRDDVAADGLLAIFSEEPEGRGVGLLEGRKRFRLHRRLHHPHDRVAVHLAGRGGFGCFVIGGSGGPAAYQGERDGQGSRGKVSGQVQWMGPPFVAELS